MRPLHHFSHPLIPSPFFSLPWTSFYIHFLTLAPPCHRCHFDCRRTMQSSNNEQFAPINWELCPLKKKKKEMSVFRCFRGCTSSECMSLASRLHLPVCAVYLSHFPLLPPQLMEGGVICTVAMTPDSPCLVKARSFLSALFPGALHSDVCSLCASVSALVHR